PAAMAPPLVCPWSLWSGTARSPPRQTRASMRPQPIGIPTSASLSFLVHYICRLRFSKLVFLRVRQPDERRAVGVVSVGKCTGGVQTGRFHFRCAPAPHPV